MNRILILGGSGFIGQALYKELGAFYNVHATYRTALSQLDKNKQFHLFDMELEEVDVLLNNLKPKFIISAVRGNPHAQVHMHDRLIAWIKQNDARIVFLSTANVFDRFTNFPSYEHDKTLSESRYGRLKIKIENVLLRLPPSKFVICRIPMIFGAGSPRIIELKNQLEQEAVIEVFPNVVINANHIFKLVQQLHYIINRRRRGIFHLGSSNLIHHDDLIKDIALELGYDTPRIKNVFDSNEDRQLSLLPRDNMLPKHLQLTIEDVVSATRKLP
ncbi:MAG: sugar nucleotide-binding protein [Nonlabens sp.]